MAYEKRDAAFEEWIGGAAEAARLLGNYPKVEPSITRFARIAFNAGWAARKQAQYRRTEDMLVRRINRNEGRR